MKLAEALQERADLNRLIEQLKSRLLNNALVQDGETPAEDPSELLLELDKSIERLEQLISRINLTNCSTIVNGKSLTELIARRDCLTIKLNAYQNFTHQASQTAYRATKTEIKIFSTVNVREIQKTSDMLSKELRLLDNKIQETNWQTELT